MILQGDALEQLKTLDSESVDCCITSPPYFGLRDYGVDGQLGLEPTFAEYIEKLCNIFDEVKRVLKKTGSCWVNLSDTYSGTKIGNTQEKWKAVNTNSFRKPKTGPTKSLMLIPFRFAIEMSNRGWILRNTIIWKKPNCMPASIKDRFTVDFEYFFFFTKSKKYYFEQQFEPFADATIPRMLRGVSENNKWANGPDGQTKHTMSQPRPNAKTKIPKEVAENYGSPRARNHRKYDGGNPKNAGDGSGVRGHSGYFRPDGSLIPLNPKGRNKRCVWAIPTKSFKEAHFAVYPEELLETPIKATLPPKGIVLDPFFGSGTTATAQRRWQPSAKTIGIELNPNYIKIAQKRLMQEILPL